MSKPRTAEELAAMSAAELAEHIYWKHNRGFDELTEEEINQAARWADAHWADNPQDHGQDMNQPGIMHDKHGDPIWEKKQ